MYHIAMLIDKKKFRRKDKEVKLLPYEIHSKDGKLRQVEKQRYDYSFDFDIRDEKQVRKYILDKYGPGYYRVYRWGGFPPHEEFLTKDDGTFGPDVVDGRRV